jgi:hypothetical protein
MPGVNRIFLRFNDADGLPDGGDQLSKTKAEFEGTHQISRGQASPTSAINQLINLNDTRTSALDYNGCGYEIFE